MLAGKIQSAQPSTKENEATPDFLKQQDLDSVQYAALTKEEKKIYDNRSQILQNFEDFYRQEKLLKKKIVYDK